MELINPNCSALRPKESPSWGRIPALIENEKAVVMSARQLALNKAPRLMVWVMDGAFGFWVEIKQSFERVQNK